MSDALLIHIIALSHQQQKTEPISYLCSAEKRTKKHSINSSIYSQNVIFFARRFLCGFFSSRLSFVSSHLTLYFFHCKKVVVASLILHSMVSNSQRFQSFFNYSIHNFVVVCCTKEQDFLGNIIVKWKEKVFNPQNYTRCINFIKEFTDDYMMQLVNSFIFILSLVFIMFS